MFGGEVWGKVMAAVVIVSGIGALNGWTMITADMPRAAAKDGLFPSRFKQSAGEGRAGVRHHRLHGPRLGGDDHRLRRRLGRPDFVRDTVVAGLSLVVSVLFIWYSRNTGHDLWVYWAPFLLTAVALLGGIPVYKRMHGEMKDPGGTPEYR